MGWVYGRSYLVRGCLRQHEVKAVGMGGVRVVAIRVEVVMVDME